jgi:phosphoribosylformylglycinamidine (FGAM) synthase PurS component
MYWRVEVKEKEGVFDGVAQSLKAQVGSLGLGTVDDVRILTVTFLIGRLSREDARRIAENLLIDAVTQEYSLYSHTQTVPVPGGTTPLQIMYKPGVMDPVEESTQKGIRDLGIVSVVSVHTAKKYLFRSALPRETLVLAAEKLLFNKLIQFVLPGEEHELKDFSRLPGSRR